MRKIYSLVLMTAMLFVGANAWATNHVMLYHLNDAGNVVGDPVEYFDLNGVNALQRAINAVNPGDTARIELLDNIMITSNIVIPMVEGTISESNPVVRTRAAQRISIKMNGFNIDDDDQNITKAIACIQILKGTLHLTGQGQVIHSKANGGSNPEMSVITVYGAPWSHKQEVWTRLMIDEQVIVTTAQESTGRNYGICIQEFSAPSSLPISKSYIGYTTYETDYPAAANDSIKCSKETKKSDGTFYNPKRYTAGCAYGIQVLIKGQVYGRWRGINVVGNIHPSPECDENYTAKGRKYPNPSAAGKAFYYDNFYPYVKIYPGAQVWCAESGATSGNGGIYGGGYAVYDISGYVHGQTGIFVKSGDVKLIDATVASDYQGTPQNGKNYGETVSGTGIYVGSDAGYTGDIEVSIGGDTKVTGGSGAAITDVLATNAEGSNVTNISITGGTIEPGGQGTINITVDTQDKTNVTGGNIESQTITVTDSEGNTQSVDLSTLVPTSEDYHTTSVTDPETGKVTVIVSEGAAPSGQTTVMGGVASVNWKHNDASTTPMTETIKATVAGNDTVVTLTELEINQSYAQTLTIKSGSELNVGRVVLGTNAQIIVEPGAVFNVTGDQGIVAPVVSNIVLRAEPGKPSIFLFKPQVTSNRHPNATVEFITNSYYTNSSDFRNQRMGIPAYEGITSMTVKSMDGATNIPTGVAGYINGEWNILGYLNVAGQPSPVSKMTTPFAYYQLSCNVPEGTNSRVTMTGALVGNVNHTFSTPAGGGWSTFANSYSGIMSAEEMMNMFPASATIDKTIWTYKTTGSGTEYAWKSFNYANIAAGLMGNLDPMQAFLLKTDAGAEAVELGLNYENMVYNPRLTTSVLATAPARAESDMMVVSINVSRDQDWKDGILMLEGSQFSADYENGFDAEKCMTEFVNLYVTADRNYSNFVTNNLKHTFIGFSSVQGGTYELSFEDVADSNYDLIDMVSNQRVSLNAGNTYTFTVDDNYVNDYRFEIVERQNMPTDIDVVEQNVQNTNGIYTITGQYLGNMSVWNSLPAGMYIVDGVKKVK